MTYYLADANLQLPKAEAAERAVLRKLDAETSDWTLDEAPTVLFNKTSLLVACWDTMGWILFREGKFADARAWISAAYHNDPRDVLREHMDAVDAALHRTPVSGETTGSSQQLRTFALPGAGSQHGTAELRLLLAGGKVIRAADPSHTSQSGKSGADLTDAAGLAQTADLSVLFPPESHAKLARSGFVNCTGDKCILVLNRLGQK